MIEFLTPNGRQVFEGSLEEFDKALNTLPGVKDKNGWVWSRYHVYAYREEQQSFDPVYEQIADEDARGEDDFGT